MDSHERGRQRTRKMTRSRRAPFTAMTTIMKMKTVTDVRPQRDRHLPAVLPLQPESVQQSHTHTPVEARRAVKSSHAFHSDRDVSLSPSLPNSRLTAASQDRLWRSDENLFSLLFTCHFHFLDAEANLSKRTDDGMRLVTGHKNRLTMDKPGTEETGLPARFTG